MPRIIKEETTRKLAKQHITWPDAVETFELSMRARRCAERSVEGYTLEVSYLQDWLTNRPEPITPGEVTVQDLRSYQLGLMTGDASRSGKKLSASTVARVAAQLRAFFSFLEGEGLVELDPTRRLERPRVPPRAPGEVLSTTEVQRLITAADSTTPKGLRDRAIVELLYATGIRRNELRALDLGDLDHEEREITVLGKGSKVRRLPVLRSAWASLMHYLELGRPSLVRQHPDSAAAIFLSRSGARISETGLALILTTLGEKAKLKKHLRPHTMRRTCATHLMKAGVNLRTIQTLLGHAKLDTTAIYLRLNPEETRREIVLRHPRERLDA